MTLLTAEALWQVVAELQAPPALVARCHEADRITMHLLGFPVETSRYCPPGAVVLIDWRGDVCGILDLNAEPTTSTGPR